MTAGRRPALAPLLAAVLVLAACAACGRKGPPAAPERRVPQPVADLSAVVREDGIQLTWSIPARRVDNSRLTNPAVGRIFRVEDSGEGEPRDALLKEDRIAGYTDIATVRLAEPPSPLVQGNRVVYLDRRMLTLGRRYTYVVLTVDADGHTSPPSRRLSVTFLAAPEPPVDLRAEPGDREAKLAWRPPARLTDGSPVTGPLVYDVLRAPSAEAPFAVIARTEPGATSATDRPVENERTYRYAVRAIRQEGGTVIEGEPTPAVAVTPLHVTPPAPPANLVAIPSQGTVRLSWTPSPGADIAGYIVYRADAGGPFQRVGTVRVPGTTFTDRDVPSGPHRYAVTAQDTSARALESRRSNEVTVTVP
jgi:predicted small lipoprotein YifL